MMQYTANDLSGLYVSEIAQKQRLLIKVGTYVLTNQNTGKINPEKIEEIVDQVAQLYLDGKELGIVSSGAVGAGKAEKGIDAEVTDLALRQALAAIGQPKLMQHYEKYFAKHEISTAQFLASYDDLNSTEHRKNFVNTVKALYTLGGIPILNENDPFSTEELKAANGNGERSYGTMSFGDNDLMSVMAAQTLDSQVLFLLSEKPGLMDFERNEKIHVVEDVEDVMNYVLDGTSKGGRGGMVAKLRSIDQATEHGIFVVLLSGLEDNAILRVLQGEALGTLFLPKNFKYTA